jgi:uncharacterized membrane protein
MSNKYFSIREILSLSWQIFKKQPVFFILIPYVPVFVSSIIGWGGSFIIGGIEQLAKQNLENVVLSTSVSVLSGGIQLVGWIASMLVAVGLLSVYLDSVKGKSKRFADLFAYKQLILPYLLTTLIIGAVAFPAFLVFIIPGIIWTIATQFSTYELLVPGTGPIVAIQASLGITKGVRLKLFLFSIVLLFINLGGLLCLGIGLLVTIPLTGLATAAVYVKLKEQLPSITETVLPSESQP